MHTMSSGRWSVAAAMAAGALWSLLGLLSLAMPDPSRYLDMLMLLTLVVTIPAVTAVYLIQRGQVGRLGRLALPMVVSGLVLMAAGMIAHLARAEEIFGMAPWVIGLVLLGIVTVRARVLPVWSGIALALSQPLAVLAGVAFSPISPLSNFGDYTGAVAHGIVWVSIGVAMRSQQAARGQRSTFTAAG
jgi:hypothetical protein